MSMNFEDCWKSNMGEDTETPERLALKKLAHVFFLAGEFSATSNIMETAVAFSRRKTEQGKTQ